MLVKFMQKSKGSSGAVEYLLDKKRVEEKTAVVISGNSEITKKLIANISRKQKYISGGLFFSEKEKVSEQQKKDLMRDFEKMFFAGMPENSYNILWVEHSDKNRVELNFLIPDVDLNSGFGLENWSYKRDLPIVNTWKDWQNLKNGFADPNSSERKREEKKSFAKFKGDGSIILERASLKNMLEQMVVDNLLFSRDQIIDFLKQNDCEITRSGKDYISVKHPSLGKKALRLEGEIFNEKFTREHKRETRINEARTDESPSRSLSRIEKRFDKYFKDRAERLSRIYRGREKREPKLENDSVFYGRTSNRADDNFRVEIGEKENDRIRTDVTKSREQRARTFEELQSGAKEYRVSARSRIEADIEKLSREFREIKSGSAGAEQERARKNKERFDAELGNAVAEFKKQFDLNYYRISYQNKVAFNVYKNDVKHDLKGFFVDKKPNDTVVFSNKSKNVSVIDKGNALICNKKGSNLEETVELMISLAEAKKWNLDTLEVSGGLEFKEAVKKEIEFRKEIKKAMEYNPNDQSQFVGSGMKGSVRNFVSVR